MNGIVVDASVTLSWCFPDEQTALSLKVLERLKAGESLVVPVFWSVEVLNTLLLAERKRRITFAQTQAFLVDLTSLRLTVEPVSIKQVTGPIQKICRDYRLTPYYAIYVELAMRTRRPLATLDKLQMGAAKALEIECL